jgi:hypothetical protein
MTQTELRTILAAIAEEAGGMHGILTSDLRQDPEGFPIPDNSDLSDAWLTLGHIESKLSRLIFKIAEEGITGR